MHIAILGRQPALGLAELERVFGSDKVSIVSPEAVLFEANQFDIQKFGGLTKAGIIIDNLSDKNWNNLSQKIIDYLTDSYKSSDNKITLGLSAYNFIISPRDLQAVGLRVKSNLKKFNTSLRLVPNNDSSLNTATSHHNKLGLSPNKIELLIVKTDNNEIVVATSTGAQNITAYSKRDQVRPKRDAFVGMLPPKLAQIMINLAVGPNQDKQLTILDPFCGTGVILQEAALMGHAVYGTDLAEKMVRYSRDNLNWLIDSHHLKFDWYLHQADAMKAKWRQPIEAVVCETYLGQPFSAPPSKDKLHEVVGNCNHIVTEFLKNISKQIESRTPICLAVPAWRDKDGRITRLPLLSNLSKLGLEQISFKNLKKDELIYFREDQIVARELLILVKI